MSTITLEVANKEYEVGKLSALDQFHVLRRLMPTIAAVGVTAAQLKSFNWMEMLGPISDALSKMTDDEANYLIFKCLSVVRRRDGEMLARVTTPDGQLMYQDMDMMTMIRLVVEVVKFNHSGFFSLLGAATESAGS